MNEGAYVLKHMNGEQYVVSVQRRMIGQWPQKDEELFVEFLEGFP